MQKKSLLLIDSSQVLMDLTRKILEREGYTVRCAVGCAGAREHLMDFMPDGIILGNDLPDGNGLDCCRELRKENAVPIMFLSNVKENELPALQAGATDFLKKPYDNDIMTTRIGVMLNIKPAAVPVEIPQATEATPPRQQPALANAVAGLSPPPRLSKAQRFLLTAAACFVLALIGIVVLNMLFNRPPYLGIVDEQIPLAEFNFQLDENAKPYSGTEQGIMLPRIDSLTIPVDTVDVALLLPNPKDNPCYFVFEIFLPDQGESLYSSGMVKPGMCIEGITLARRLAKGDYNANVKIRAYSLEDFSTMGSVTMEFALTVD